MQDISLHILDIAENSIDAGATRIEIKIKEDLKNDRFILIIKDNGKGMEVGKKTKDPYFTCKTGKKFGLGIPFLAQAAEECNGRFSLSSEKGKGTTVVAEFQRSHIDLKPLGDMGATMTTLICGHPEIDYLFLYEKNGQSFSFDTKELKQELDGVPVNLPEVLKFIKEEINEGLRRIKG
jgi:anti-sigma regulatory factor (Ser/Thr protein kinase)